MAIKSRGQIACDGDIIQLRAEFRNISTGALTDLTFFPEISIQQPSGNVIFPFTSTGVYHLATGIYGFDFEVSPYSEVGVWTDNWRGSLSPVDGYNQYNQHNFVIYPSQMPQVNTDGYVALGDEPGFCFSQVAIKNINKLIYILKSRLNSSGKAKVKDQYGNDVLIDCDIYTIPQLVTFLIAAIEAFNMIPHFTYFTFEDTDFLNIFGEIIVRHALVYALASKALIEKGREFNISDNGVTFQPPGVSDVLMTQYSTEYTHWQDDVRLIKANMKPQAIGLGTLRPLSSSPAYRRLRHLRERSIY